MFRYSISSQLGSRIKKVKIALCDTYGPLLAVSFPRLKFDWINTGNGYGECTMILTVEQESKLLKLLELFKSSVLLLPNDDLRKNFADEIEHCHALDYNMEMDDNSGEWRYTSVGGLEHRAKGSNDGAALNELGQLMADFANTHPLYSVADTLLPVPGNPSKKIHFPNGLVDVFSRLSGLKNGTGLVRKTCDTERVQDLHLEDKVAAIEPFLVGSSDLKGVNCIVVDDLYQSGSTMWTVARCAKRAGANHIFGLACVKARRSTDNL